MAQALADLDPSSVDFNYSFLKGMPLDPNSRPRHINIPTKTLDAMTDMERQFWTIQKEYFDVVLFWAKGTFYELFELNALIASREFGLKMAGATRGKMRMAGVPQKSFAEWSRLFVFKGYKVGRVEQMVVDEDALKAAGGKAPKVMPRKLKVILTRGTLTESNAIAGPEPVYVMAIVPSPAAGGAASGGGNSDEAAAYSFDCVAVDLTRQVYHYCPCDSVNELVTVLHHMQPKEVLVPALDAKSATNFLSATEASSSSSAAAASTAKGGAAAASSGAAAAAEEKSVLDATTVVCSIVSDLLRDCTIERIFSKQSKELAIAAAARAINTNNNKSSSSQQQQSAGSFPLFGSSGSISSGNLDPFSASQIVGLPAAWHLVHEYFKYLCIDADRLLPTKFSFGNDTGSVGGDGALPAVKKEKGAVGGKNDDDDDDDDEVAEAEFAFKLYTLHRRSAGGGAASASSDDASLQQLQQRAAARQQPVRLLQLERRFDRGLALDAAAIEALDLVVNSRDGTSASTVLSWLVGEGKRMPGAARMLREWLLCPSSNADVITGRQGAVGLIMDSPSDLKPLIDGWNRLLEKKSSGAGAGHAGAAAAAAAAAAAGNDDDDDDDDDDAGGSAATKKKGRNHAWIVQSDVAIGTIDFERLLSRISDFKSEDVKVSVVEPLALYPKHLQNIHVVLKGFEILIGFQKAAAAALTAFKNKVADSATAEQKQQHQQQCQLLTELLDDLGKTEKVHDKLLRKFPRDSIARNEGLLLPNPGQNPAYDNAQQTIDVAERTMREKLKDARKKFGTDKIEYRSIGKEQFLLEVSTAKASAASIEKAGFPKGELAERARTKTNVKFAMNSMQELITKYKKAVLARENAIVQTLRDVAAAVCSAWHVLFPAARAAAYLDGLFGLASASRQQSCIGDVSFPKFIKNSNDSTSLQLRDAYHPLLFVLKRKCIPNSLSLGNTAACAGTASAAAAAGTVMDDDHNNNNDNSSTNKHDQRVLVLTGPNMAGKSTLMRTVAVNVVLSQMGCMVCAKEMTVSGAPVDRVFTRIGAKDATHRGQSTLYVELSETAAIMREATGRSLCLLDELGRGTSTHDGYAIAHACLRDLAGISCTFPAASGEQQLQHRPAVPLVLFATHYHALAVEVALMEKEEQGAKQQPRIQLGYMDFASGTRRQRTSEGVVSMERDPVTGMKKEREALSGRGQDEEDQEDAVSVRTDVEMLYKLVPGICARSYGAEVALQAGLPRQLVEKARGVSRQMALQSADHQLLDLKNFLEGNSGEQPQQQQNQELLLDQVRGRATQILAMANAAATAADVK